MKEYLDILGFKVRDMVTGFVGVAGSVCFDLYGCVMPLPVFEMVAGGEERSMPRAFVVSARQVPRAPARSDKGE
jgi:hypothetical protein